MINSVSIENFKSLKDVSFESRRVNIFIGEPNTGKSNLLEALGVFSATAGNFRSIFRYRTIDNLFYDNEVSNNIIIKVGNYRATMTFKNDECQVVMTEDNSIPFPAIGGQAAPPNELTVSDSGTGGFRDVKYPFRYYKFSSRSKFVSNTLSFLSVPDGDNLFGILRSNKDLRELVMIILEDKGYRLNLRIADKEIELVKDEDGILYSYPYQSVSDTLQRIVFYLAAITSNKHAVLLLEEPEANTFPFYTKYLAERIALEESNQYFIVTHNPYFLLSLVEKTPIDQLAVFITYMEQYETKLRRLTDTEMSELIDLNTDIFFNLDKFLSSPHEPFPRM